MRVGGGKLRMLSICTEKKKRDVSRMPWIVGGRTVGSRIASVRSDLYSTVRRR